MVTCAQVEMPYVRVVLDTTPPRVSVAADGIVTPPADWTAVLTTSEPYGRLEVALTDAGGDSYAYGVARTGPTTAMLRVPTIGLSPGGAMLSFTVADLVGNVVMVNWPLVVDLPADYDVALDIDEPYDVEARVGVAYDIETGTGPVFVLVTYPDRAYEITLDDLAAYALEVEITDA